QTWCSGVAYGRACGHCVVACHPPEEDNAVAALVAVVRFVILHRTRVGAKLRDIAAEPAEVRSGERPPPGATHAAVVAWSQIELASGIAARVKIPHRQIELWPRSLLARGTKDIG